LAGPTLSLQASYSFLEDLNSPNLSQAELNEIAADPKADLSESDSSNDSESEVAKVNEEFISNEKASSGLTVCLDFFLIFCARCLV
jgi:20S proteasome alpha/beta subunit